MTKFDRKLWTQVFGKSDPDGFKKIFKDLTLYLAFGGGDSFPHGISCVGRARFELLGFDIK